MNYRAHLYTGALSGLAIGITAAPDRLESVLLPCAIAGCLGGIAPDIDIGGSHISHKAPILSFLSEKIFGHRGFLHTPAFLLVLAIPVIRLGYPGGFALLAGYASHLILDLLTPKGIMLLYPVNRHYYHLFGFKSRFRDFLAILAVSAIFVFYYKAITG